MGRGEHPGLLKPPASGFPARTRSIRTPVRNRTPSILRGGFYLGERVVTGKGNRSPDKRLRDQVDQGGSIPRGVGETIVVEIHEDVPLGVHFLEFRRPLFQLFG
jgi:hypothetical protein